MSQCTETQMKVCKTRFIKHNLYLAPVSQYPIFRGSIDGKKTQFNVQAGQKSGVYSQEIHGRSPQSEDSQIRNGES